MRAARTCLFIIRHIGDSDYDFLDPIIGVSISSWNHTSPVLDEPLTLMSCLFLFSFRNGIVLLGLRGKCPRPRDH